MRCAETGTELYTNALGHTNVELRGYSQTASGRQKVLISWPYHQRLRYSGQTKIWGTLPFFWERAERSGTLLYLFNQKSTRWYQSSRVVAMEAGLISCTGFLLLLHDGVFFSQG